MSTRTKKRLSFLAGFILYFVLLWALWDTVVIYPVKIFVVLLHEISHAMAALAPSREARPTPWVEVRS